MSVASDPPKSKRRNKVENYSIWLFFMLALPVHLQFTAGAIAGVSEISVMYPLDGK